MNVTALLAFDRQYNVATLDGKCIPTCSSDKKLFKSTTSTKGAVCIVGAKTFLNDFDTKVLPGRRFLIFYKHSDRDIILEEIDELKATQVFVIGGGKTYEEFLDITNEIHYSHIFKDTANPGMSLKQACPTMYSIVARDIENRLLFGDNASTSRLVQHHKEGESIVGYTRQIILR